MNTLGRLGRSIPAGKVRVGVVSHARLESWQGSVIEAVRADPAIHLESWFVLPGSPGPQPSLLAAKYEAWSSKISAPQALVDGSKCCSGLEQVGIAVEGSGELSPATRSKIAAHQLDVLLWLDNTRPSGECRDLARFGVWAFSLGNPRERKPRPAYFDEINKSVAVSELYLLVHSRDFAAAAVLDRYAAATQFGWYATRAAVDPVRAAGALLLRRLLDLLEFGPQSFLERLAGAESVECSGAQERFVGGWELSQYLVRQAVRSAVLRLQDRGRAMRWFIAARSSRPDFTGKRAQFTPAGFRRLLPEVDGEAADPFLIEHNGRNFLFFEEIPRITCRGRISCCEVKSDLQTSTPVPVIEQPYHMSYPFLIEDRGEIFMLPETSANGEVQLYWATNFPHEWRLQKILCEGIALVDTTPYFHDGTWYFFTSSAETGEGLLFCANSLEGEWRYHPANPICLDVRRARGAGALFTRGTQLIRPAQDCSVRYGYAITLNEVLTLTPERYSERLVETILPEWAPGLLGTHTLNASQSIEVVDGSQLG